MQFLRTLALTLLTVPCALAAPQNSQVPSSAVLPSVTAYALDKAKVTLPADFATPLNLLILSFQRDQQPVVDGWLPLVNAGATPRIQTWLLPISQRENGVYRWWLNASLRGSQAASQPRHNTVPLYVDKRQFLNSLQVASEQQVVVLLTDRAGRVLWRSAGPLTDGKKADFNNFLTKSTPR
jgi:hypothetical protein